MTGPPPEVLRTPDHRFRDLPGYPWAPRYVDVDGLRMHYVDEGPSDAPPVLLLHGEPSWSYLYRTMIPVIAGAGFRAVAPDLVGFGRSDKPARTGDHTYARQVAWTTGFIETLDLRGITLFCQDWGGLIGLRIVAERGDRFDRVAAANTFLATGDRVSSLLLRAWQAFARYSPVLPVGLILRAGCARRLPRDVVRAYRAPFPDRRFKAGPRALPRLLPLSPDDPGAEASRAAWDALRRWERPFLTLFSNGDPITRGLDRHFRSQVPGAAGQPHDVIRGAGHFLQEDRGVALAERVVEWMRS